MIPPGLGQCLIQRDSEGDWLRFGAPRAICVARRLDEVRASPTPSTHVAAIAGVAAVQQSFAPPYCPL